jgi:hypothetical protein
VHMLLLCSSDERQANAIFDKLPASPTVHADLDADNRITDQFVQRLQSRDLTLVKGISEQETKDADYGEKAIYVVSKGTGKNAAACVFSNIILDHK